MKQWIKLYIDLIQPKCTYQMNFAEIWHIDVASVGRNLSIQTEVFIRSGIGDLREQYMGANTERLVSFMNMWDFPRSKEKDSTKTLPSAKFCDELMPSYLYPFNICIKYS